MTVFRVAKILAGVLLTILVAFSQLSLINNLVSPWNHFHLVLVILFFIVILVDYHLGFWYAVISGLILEIYSPAIFGGIFFALVVTVLMVNFLFNLFFTNRSLYPLLLLSTVGLIIFNCFNFLYLNIAYWLGWSFFKIELAGYYVVALFWQIFLTLIVLTIVFLISQLFSKRFKSVFLVEGRR